ncbi:HIPL1 protein-like [Lolium rigidum]|uniref:HIPL1 protein-like n=1 Tax=Lolium rigidum TaxID=89674 RepID=UPI001F5C5AA4|nr:HIPL1 protein-like [Lolium rigidum]
MGIRLPLLLLVCLLAVVPGVLPLCTDSRAPVVPNATLKFCQTDGGSCCDADADAALQEQFEAMGVKPGGACGRLVKSILCSKCNPFSADLFGIGSTARTVPLLCSSSFGPNYSQPVDTEGEYCEQVWKDCKSTAISNSPFQPRNAVLTGSASMLTDFWHSENDFCASHSGTPHNQSVCFNGHGVSFNARTRKDSSPSPTPTAGVCLEKIGNGSYLNMVAHPDGSSKAFFSRQDGKIWLATVPEQGMQDGLEIDEMSPFLDLATEGHLSSDLGLVGVAFHPDFANNGRFFVSYICDGAQSPNCAGRCSCDHEVECDPSKLGSDKNGVHPCQYHLVISEYSAEGSPSRFSEATYADPSEVRRVFSMGLPYVSNHAGQLLFGPTDGYLYFFTGNGGIRGDPFNFSQNKKSLLGKIMRLNIDELPELNEVANLSLWGNYTIPKDNPNADDSTLRPEIWALGLENPWRCSFDSGRPFHLYCADDVQDEYKVIDLISKGGNYGWVGVYEDQHVGYPPWAAQVTKPTQGIIFPIMGYKVSSSTPENMESASIVGGYVYRGTADPCLYGRYLFADMYMDALWTGTDGISKYTSTSIPLRCSEKSPIPCDESANGLLGLIFSFGEDNKLDVFILASQGVYRIVQPTLCGYAHLNSASTDGVTPSGGSNGMSVSMKALVAAVVSILVAAVAGVAGVVAWRCYFNNTAFCCNGNVQVTNNNTIHGDGNSAKPGDIELAMPKPEECRGR